MPKVSILMCVYNGETHLKEAIDSILEQTFADFEFVIVEDGSTDRTPEILAEYAAQDSRIVLIRNNENLGLEKSLNRGLVATQGEYFARQDADDISLPNRLELQVKFLDEHPEVCALGSAVQFIDEKGNVWGEDHLPTDHDSLRSLLLINNFMHHSSMMIRRDLLQNLGGYDTTMRYTEDYDLWWRLSSLSHLATLPDILVRRRLDDGPRISKLYREKQLQYAYKLSLRAVQESLPDASSLNEEAYQTFWWTTLLLFDKEAYQRFWLSQCDRALLSSQTIQQLQPFWKLLATLPKASKIWGPRLCELAYELLRQKQVVAGLQLLWVVAFQLKIPVSWNHMVKALIKPYFPSFVWKFWKTQHFNQLTN
jgi:glycosyltransferase involved in cell wall biosynthesis